MYKIVPVIIFVLIAQIHSVFGEDVEEKSMKKVSADVHTLNVVNIPTTNLEYKSPDTSVSLSDDDSHSSSVAIESRKHGIKIKKKKKKLKKAAKFLKKYLPLLLIPLLIQAKLIPLFLFKLKLIALKAFGIGKLALFLIAINVIYNAMHGAQDGDQQYSKEALANEHYGYNGGPEYGAWVNRRYYNLQN